MTQFFIYCLVLGLFNGTEHRNVKHARPKEHLSIPDYVRWVENPQNGMRKEEVFSNYEVTIQYKPCDYLIVKKARQKLNDQAIANEKSELNNLLYFDLLVRCTAHCKQDATKDSLSKMEYLGYRIQKDLRLVVGNDTLPCLMSHYEGSFGVGPYDKIMLGFENKASTGKQMENCTLFFEDHYFGLSAMNFSFSADDLNQIPTLKIP